MAIYTDPKDLIQAQRRRLAFAEAAMLDGQQRLASERVLADARALTGGSLSHSFIRDAFAVNPSPHGAGSAPALPINRRSGRLQDSFRLKQTASAGIQTISLGQSNPGGGIYRLRPGGTKKMVDSGFFAELLRRWRPHQQAFIDTFRSQINKS